MKQLAALAVTAALVVTLAWIVMEWMAGCGEHYVDSKGTVHINECVWKSEVPIKK